VFTANIDLHHMNSNQLRRMNFMSDLREKLKIDYKRLDEINTFLLDPNNELVNRLLELIEKYGGVEAINHKHEASPRPTKALCCSLTCGAMNCSM
jgi:predicted house-cleaning noncanonical NTP pyrophosphatase (MazG superfamily)